MTDSLRYKLREADWSPDQIERNLAGLHKTRKMREMRKKWAIVGGGVVTCAAALGLWLSSGAGELPQEIPGQGEEAAATHLKGATTSPVALDDSRHSGLRTVSFRDGSEAALETEGSQLHVQEVSERSIRVDLSQGGARFRVTRDAERTFVVKARYLVISAFGTDFTVRHEKARSWVGVERGKVSVQSGGEETILTAGEATWFAPSAASSADEASSDPARAASTAAPRSPKALFAKHHQSADYQAAYRILVESPQVIGENAAELLRAADAARYSGHPAEATQYLKRVPSTDPSAPSAQFTLGRLYLHQLGDPARAAEAFSLVRRLAPGGPLVEDALFREVEARSKAGETSAATRLAQSYLKQFPNSARRQKVEKWGGLL